MNCRSILNWVEGPRAANFFAANPYRGCAHACAYCYARYTHEFLDEGVKEGFERRIFVKVNAPQVLARELKRRQVWTYGVGFGSATDPYQPAELRFELTRKLLQGLLPHQGIHITVVTKSTHIERDAELLGELARRHDLEVLLSCAVLEPSMQRSLEPHGAPLERRLAIIPRLAAHGVRTKVMVAPILPKLTDDEQDLTRLCRLAREAGAVSVAGQVLFRPRASRGRLCEWLERHRPELSRWYRETYGQGLDAGRPFRKEIGARLERAASAAGFAPGTCSLRKG